MLSDFSRFNYAESLVFGVQNRCVVPTEIDFTYIKGKHNGSCLNRTIPN